MKSQKVQKQVAVIARYFMKRNGHVVYAVRSSNGVDVYCTTIINGKATGCTCPATKPCYHMVQLEAQEAARKQVATPAYDVVGAALQVANQAMIASKIGDCYDDMVAEKVASIEAVRQPTYEDHLAEDRAYRMAQSQQAIERRAAERTARETRECYVRLMQQSF